MPTFRSTVMFLTLLTVTVIYPLAELFIFRQGGFIVNMFFILLLFFGIFVSVFALLAMLSSNEYYYRINDNDRPPQFRQKK